LERLGITYFHETFGNRNKIERWFRELKERTKRLHNNVNSKKLKSLEDSERSSADSRSRKVRRKVIPT